MSKTNRKAGQPTGEHAGEDVALAPATRVTKIDTVVAMLRRPDGADVAELAEATGWQVHSVRGAIAGHIKKKMGLVVATAKVHGKTIYRIEG